ncbi:MAG: sialidase family protein [Patescibacteria group bacterium]
MQTGWHKQQLVLKWAILGLFFCAISIVVFGTESTSATTLDPSGPPPEDNTTGFIDIGNEYQIKTGALRLGTDDRSAPFNYQLEVVGDGAEISNVVAENNLGVGQYDGRTCENDADCAGGMAMYCSYGKCRYDSLYVDSERDVVCFGPCLNASGSRVEVSGSGMHVENDAGYGMYATSSSDTAVYGSGTTYGVQGISSGSNNYGIWAINTIGTALEGTSTGVPYPAYSSVAGISTTGWGIYATNTNASGLWSGYFEGRVGSTRNVVGSKLVTTKPGVSLTPFTSAQELAEYGISSDGLRYYDGTNLWLADGNTLIKVRASDGFLLLRTALSGAPTDVIFDQEALWVTVSDGTVLRLDPVTGTAVCSLDLAAVAAPVGPLSNPLGIVYVKQREMNISRGQGTTYQHYWVTATGSAGAGAIVELTYEKRSGACAFVAGSAQEIVSASTSIGKMAFDGDYLWILAQDSVSREGYLVSVHASDGEAALFPDIVGSEPTDIVFDNSFLWVTNSLDDTLSRISLAGSHVCSIKDGYLWRSCSANLECAAAGLGQCFQVPIPYGLYDTADEPTYVAFDGTYVWAASDTNPTVSQFLAADPADRDDHTLSADANGLLFDGTNVWVSHDAGITKLFSGTGFGAADLGDTLTLQNAGPVVQQPGSISITDSAFIGQSLIADSELTVSDNVWADEQSGDVIRSDEWEIAGQWSGGGVLAVAVTGNGTVLAGDKYNGHIYRSTDRGDTWADTGSYGQWVWGILEAHDGMLYAATGDESGIGAQVYTSADDGQTWQMSTAVFPTAGNHAYECAETYFSSDWWVACGSGFDDYVWRTNNGGTTWIQSAALPGSGSDSPWALFSASDGYLYVASKWNSHVYRTADGGTTWETLADIPGVSGVYDLLEGSDGALYAATGCECATMEGHVFKSVDGGSTWLDVIDVTGDGMNDVYAIIESEPGVFYFTTRAEVAGPSFTAHVYRALDYGSSWAELPLSITPDINELSAVTIGPDGTIYLGGSRSSSMVVRSSGFGAGTYSCPDGHFIKDVQRNYAGEVIRIECRAL